jgi:hypothetical protein
MILRLALGRKKIEEVAIKSGLDGKPENFKQTKSQSIPLVN